MTLIKKINLVLKALAFSFYWGLIAVFIYFFGWKSDKKNCRHDVIVSFTSYGWRKYFSIITAATIYSQTHRVSKIILFLSGKDYTAYLKFFDEEKLKRFNLVIIKSTADYKSYLKLIEVQRFIDQEDYIITVDDDVIYHKDLIGNLLDGVVNHNGSVATIARVIDKSKPYVSWPHAKPPAIGKDLLPLGVGGVLYQAHQIPEQLWNHWPLISKVAPSQDDLYFKKYISINVKVVQSKRPIPLFSSFFTQKLYSQNRRDNDKAAELLKL